MPDSKDNKPAETPAPEQWRVTTYAVWETGDGQGRWANPGAVLSDLSDAELKSLKSNKAVERVKPEKEGEG